MRAEWKGGADFHEHAEALGVPTDHIVAAVQSDGIWTVMYSPDLTNEDDPTVYGARLKRDAEGILRRASVDKVVPGFWREVKERIERGLGESGLDKDEPI